MVLPHDFEAAYAIPSGAGFRNHPQYQDYQVHGRNWATLSSMAMSGIDPLEVPTIHKAFLFGDKITLENMAFYIW